MSRLLTLTRAARLVGVTLGDDLIAVLFVEWSEVRIAA